MQETRHRDGKVERMFGDGRRMIMFPNGTIKEQVPEGRSTVCFTNGDVKRTLADGACPAPALSPVQPLHAYLTCVGQSENAYLTSKRGDITALSMGT